MKINIGAGDDRYEGFLNCDYDKNCNPDFVFDLEKDRFPFEDNSVEQVIAHHVLEHLGEGYIHAIQELYRICTPGAKISILVPHPRSDDFLDDPTHRRAITPTGLRLFSKKYNDLCKEQKVRSSRLGYFYNVDFEIEEVVQIPYKENIKRFDGKSFIEVNSYVKEHNNIISEYLIKLIVIK